MGDKNAGLDMDKGVIGDMQELGIRDSYKVKRQILLSASEAAEMLLRVDVILTSAPRQRDNDPRMM
jgi:T-complex protein 1 subunit beta